MPFQYSIQPQAKMAFVVAEGPIDEMSSIQAIMDVVSDPDFIPTYKVLVNLQNMDYHPKIQALFTISDRLASIKNKLQGEVILLVSHNMLYLAHLSCVMARAAGVNMNAVTEYEMGK